MTPLRRTLEEARIVLCVGHGGVGKTTIAAALATWAARRGRRTAVLTVDPAQRLKDTLGLGRGDGPRRVSLGGLGARAGHLDAYLLDVKRTFDELIIALAAPEQARTILENRLYQNLSGSLAGTAEYMAVERVYRLAHEGGYDLVVVDTPPARHAVDFLDAPRRLLALLESRVFGILKDPTTILPAGGSRLARFVLDAVLSGLERFTGIGLVREVGDFVRAIDTLSGALTARIRAVQATLAGAGTSLVLVAAPEPRLVSETGELVEALGRTGLRIGGIVVNRSLPRALFEHPADVTPLPGLPPALTARLRRGYEDMQALAARQEAVLAPLVAKAKAPVVGRVPLMAAGPGSLAELAAIGAHLFPEADEPAVRARGLGQ
jgi:anion-transporting  ArsA/GET3 family ATPase